MDSPSKVDDPLHAIRRHERIAINCVGLLSDTIHASRTLNQPNDCPRQIVVDDHVAILKVLTFAEDVSRDQNPQLVLRLHDVPFLVAFWAE